MIYGHTICDMGWNQTLLHYCAKEGNADVLKELLNQNCDLHWKTFSDGKTPLHIAAGCGKLECLKLLVDAGADVNCLDKETSTPLHIAAAKNRIFCLKELILHTANINAKDMNGRTPLHLASSYIEQGG